MSHLELEVQRHLVLDALDGFLNAGRNESGGTKRSQQPGLSQSDDQLLTGNAVRHCSCHVGQAHLMRGEKTRIAKLVRLHGGYLRQQFRSSAGGVKRLVGAEANLPLAPDDVARVLELKQHSPLLFGIKGEEVGVELDRRVLHSRSRVKLE